MKAKSAQGGVGECLGCVWEVFVSIDTTKSRIQAGVLACNSSFSGPHNRKHYEGVASKRSISGAAKRKH